MPRWDRALVTGASAGIGAEFARLLAHERTHLVLVARRQHLLEALAAELRANAVEVEVIKADLTDRNQLERVAQRLAHPDAPIDLLINNAGISVLGPFHEQPLSRHEELLAVCALAPMVLTHFAIQAMSARGGRGSIINVSSVCGSGPIAGLASYSGAKGFLNNLSQAAATDLDGSGVTITTVLPGPTRTQIDEIAGGSVETGGAELMDPREVARQSLDAAAQGRRHVVPGYVNRVRTLLTPRFTGGPFGKARDGFIARARRPSHLARRFLARLRGGGDPSSSA
jgi:short-subunit dehydrogenase